MLRQLGRPQSVRAGWIPSLLSALQAHDARVRYTVVALSNVKRETAFSESNVDYIVLPWSLPTHGAVARALARARALTVETEADVVHVHGSETIFSELAVDASVRIPVCVSIQGLLSKYSAYQHAGLTKSELLGWQLRPRDLLLRQGPLFNWCSWRRKAQAEVRLLRRASFFVGRTAWDRANVLAQNPDAWYGHGDEVMRDVFYQDRDRATPAGAPVLLLGRASPIKGVTVFLSALSILKRRRINFKARVFGRFDRREGLGRILSRRIETLGLQNDISLIGSQTEEEVARELSGASLFVHPSFMDNSPNSICEAMLLGVPVVATCCGGVSSLISHGETGLLVPPGDAEVLADTIAGVLSDPREALRMADNARRIAARRHDPQRVAAAYLTLYREIAQRFTQSRSLHVQAGH
jgi:glycosyltransferase involved in cell wall biosynthesis